MLIKFNNKNDGKDILRLYIRLKACKKIKTIMCVWYDDKWH